MLLGRKKQARVGMALTAAAFVLLAMPSAASALPFIVNSTGDGSDALAGNSVCETVTGNGVCTLRAAIQETNALAGTDSISFLGPGGGGPFSGNAGTSTITLGSSLPAITQQVFIDGGDCAVSGPPKPCAAVNANNGVPLRDLNAIVFFDDSPAAAPSGSQVMRLAIFGARTAIVGTAVPGQSVDNVVVEGNWLGMNLDQSPMSNADANESGVSIVGNGWDIGGTTSQERNVFRASISPGAGVVLFGGDNNLVKGNYFGTDASGASAPTLNSDAIQVFSRSDIGDGVATGNVIGGADPGTPSVCDGPCNVIALDGTGAGTALINLQRGGDDPPGSTTIAGNFIGLQANGSPASTSSAPGVIVGDGVNVTIGGANSADGNFIGGAEIGVLVGDNPNALPPAGESQDLLMQNNLIGVQPDGTGEVAPSMAGALVTTSPGPGDRPQILDNTFAGDSTAGQDGLRLTGAGGTVSGNDFGRDSTTAPQPFGSSAVEITGSLYQVIGGNQIHNGRAAGIDVDGGDFNTINANTIEDNGAAGAGPGVRIQNTAVGNVLGGDPMDNPPDVNTYINNAGDAIEVLGDGSDLNLLLGNLTNGNDSATGAGAGDLMIDLNGDGPGNPMVTSPNEEVQAPLITTASTTAASGTAEPGAPVMLYSADATGPAQPSAVVDDVIADVSGNWTVTYPTALPVGARVFANQSPNESTSELAGPVSVTAPATGGGGPAATLPPAISGPTGQRAAALKKCKKRKTAAKRKKCRKKARQLPP